jgi:thymidylate synthase
VMIVLRLSESSAVREDRVLVWWPMEARRMLPCHQLVQRIHI